MNYIKHQTALFERFADDIRISPYHISLYFALFQLWNKNRFRNPFPIYREEVMFLAHIGSTNTYAKSMRELRDWHYIDYIAAGNRHTGWKVSCIRFDTGSATRTDTGNTTGTTTGSATVYKEVNSTNSTNSIKQDHQKNFNNGKAKISGGRFHVSNDKDYSEPL